MVPIQTKLIEVALLTAEERDWVNKYNAECLAKVGPLLKGDALKWLQKETAAI